ncbi:CIA30-domain-containing protein [Ceraceosorus guamensis]|uniref:CIA30-domain-containing protein n=1 Tax=Ceraceosorus guamensis TaxID=1522189 RepID=A0A316VXY3_9BASI|nr:CIA30-domain-containing protein [Ceraceosorus guamensis]PWN42517.1 CIA30-domain-containing protein [Ceraceosorus guamensis]
MTPMIDERAQPGSAETALSLLRPFPRAKDDEHAWRSKDFTPVNDSIRGGISNSDLEVVGEQVKGAWSHRDAGASSSDLGEAIFSGFLDTTKLGGAGFASQSFTRPLPQKLDAHHFSGLRLVIRHPHDSAASQPASEPGGGEAPVYSYVLNLRTADPVKRPDGRNESAIIYEWDFDASKAQGFDGSSYCPSKAGSPAYVEAQWKDFAATYRGRPAKDAEKLDPAKIKGFSIMARSNFGKQSGKFELRLIELQALRSTGSAFGASDALEPRFSPQDASNEKYSLMGFHQAMNPSSVPRSGETEEYPGKPRFEDEDHQHGLRAAKTSTTLLVFVFAILLALGWLVWSSKPRAMLKKAGWQHCHDN